MSALLKWKLLSLTMVGNWNQLSVSETLVWDFICLGATLLIYYKVCRDRVPNRQLSMFSVQQKLKEQKNKTTTTEVRRLFSTNIELVSADF